jgi:hypothetical protein
VKANAKEAIGKRLNSNNEAENFETIHEMAKRARAEHLTIPASHNLSTTHPSAKMFDEMHLSLSTVSSLPVSSNGVFHMRRPQHSHQYVSWC